MRKIIACDFDGTLVCDHFPEIGYPYYSTIEDLKKRKDAGDKIILWTCRNGKYLEDAVKWCEEQGIVFDAINDNLPELKDKYGGDTRKVYADEYWDDKSVDVTRNRFYSHSRNG